MSTTTDTPRPERNRLHPRRPGELTAKELAEACGVGIPYIMRLTTQGLLTSRKTGHWRYYAPEAVEEFKNRPKLKKGPRPSRICSDGGAEIEMLVEKIVVKILSRALARLENT